MIILTKSQYDEILSHCRRGLPNEGCGLLAGTSKDGLKTVAKVYGLTNIDASPEYFSLAVEDQFRVVKDARKNGWQLIGNFHSHPATPSRPSDEDKRLAFDPSLSYLILSFAGEEPVLKSFHIEKDQSQEEPIRIEEV